MKYMFENKYYANIMFILIILVILIIFFNLIDILSIMKSKNISGKAIQDVLYNNENNLNLPIIIYILISTFLTVTIIILFFRILSAFEDF